MLTIEEFLRLSNRLREYYGKQIKDRFSEYTFSPNEISILILLQNNTRAGKIKWTEKYIFLTVLFRMGEKNFFLSMRLCKM